MYSSLIARHFNNNILLWGLNAHRLIKLQKRAIRIITDSKYNSHSEPLQKSLNILKINYIFTTQCLVFFICNYMNDRVPVLSDRFSWKMHCIMTTKLDIVTVFVFRTVILPKRGNMLDITYPCFSTRYLLQMTAKLNTHSQIGLVNYTKQLLLNGYTSICLLENCYVCVETLCVLFYIFLPDNCWQNKLG